MGLKPTACGSALVLLSLVAAACSDDTPTGPPWGIELPLDCDGPFEVAPDPTDPESPTWRNDFGNVFVSYAEGDSVFGTWSVGLGDPDRDDNPDDPFPNGGHFRGLWVTQDTVRLRFFAEPGEERYWAPSDIVYSARVTDEVFVLDEPRDSHYLRFRGVCNWE